MIIQYAVIFVSDMAQATAFYRDILELPLRFESSHWTEFESQGATLALHVSDIAVSSAPAKAPGVVRIGFRVDDLDAFHERMLARNVPCVREPETEYGAKIAQYSGPDGLEFSASELL